MHCINKVFCKNVFRQVFAQRLIESNFSKIIPHRRWISLVVNTTESWFYMYMTRNILESLHVLKFGLFSTCVVPSFLFGWCLTKLWAASPEELCCALFSKKYARSTSVHWIKNGSFRMVLTTSRRYGVVQTIVGSEAFTLKRKDQMIKIKVDWKYFLSELKMKASDVFKRESSDFWYEKVVSRRTLVLNAPMLSSKFCRED